MPSPLVAGWDVGGAHVKLCLLQESSIREVGEWACPLWQGLDQLARVLGQARGRWPGIDGAFHAVTMTGEMVDLFPQREDGVQAIAALLAQTFGDRVRLYAGDDGWCLPSEAAALWQHIASANWLAAARLAARRLGDGVLIDIGSTTTDLIVFAGGRVETAERSDAERLASGALVYQGVVRTPLCALAQRIEFRGRAVNVMNEFFATTADVHRLTGELNPAHDLHPSADGAPKTLAATHQRLARMIGLDARDGREGEWLGFAKAWRSAQLREIAGQLDRVLRGSAVTADAPVIAAGCGDFLVTDVKALSSAASARPFHTYAVGVCELDSRHEQAGWVQVCAPSVAVAMLFAQDKEYVSCGS